VAIEFIDQSRFTKVRGVVHADGEGLDLSRFEIPGDDEFLKHGIGTLFFALFGLEEFQPRGLVDLAAAQFSRFDGVVDHLDRKFALADLEFPYVLDFSFENDLFGSEDAMVFDTDQAGFFGVFVDDEHTEQGAGTRDEKRSENHRPEDVTPLLSSRYEDQKKEKEQKKEQDEPMDNGEIDHG
jgi:hypothetical protein